ncbi:ectoine/hydroxyectoine ABC transporter ATP-binding protein EhuA [Streptomyces yaizuensis]|uniref:ectoine/hydroxyectoine ABC transporter ATP-binding protein EhuA n=1 Tax=Streptomyces yaizuensis TaxID=2989713 RepID=UPI003899DD2E
MLPADASATGTPEAGAGAGSGELIRFEGVTKRFGGTTVLDSLDLTVLPNRHVTLIGPSGSGKTTILRLLMTLVRPDEGTIRVGGEYLTHEERGGRLVPAGERHLREVRKNIGMVFQHFHLFPHMSVERNLTEAPVRVLGLSRDEARERARELLELVGLGERADARPGQLSGGQQQRVAIARALAMRPKVLLLDEVTSALDPELVAGVLELLTDIARSTDVTLVSVTHEMGFARDISDCVMMFDQGRVIEYGPPDKIFGAPERERTREFLSAVL